MLKADISERLIWTGVQAALAITTVEALDLPVAWTPLVAALLAFVKCVVASKVGVEGTASTLPASLDPAASPLEVLDADGLPVDDPDA